MGELKGAAPSRPLGSGMNRSGCRRQRADKTPGRPAQVGVQGRGLDRCGWDGASSPHPRGCSPAGPPCVPSRDTVFSAMAMVPVGELIPAPLSSSAERRRRRREPGCRGRRACGSGGRSRGWCRRVLPRRARWRTAGRTTAVVWRRVPAGVHAPVGGRFPRGTPARRASRRARRRRHGRRGRLRRPG